MEVKELMDLVLKCVWFLSPAALANPTAVLVRKIRILENPVDFNRTFRNKPIFGRNKTWRGLIFGTGIAVIIFIFQKWLYQFSFFERISLINYNETSLFLGFLLGFGAMSGDLIKSFFKRRLNILPSQPWFPFDQVDWVFGALVFSSVFYFPPAKVIILMIFLGLFFHLIINYLGFRLGLKENKF